MGAKHFFFTFTLTLAVILIETEPRSLRGTADLGEFRSCLLRADVDVGASLFEYTSHPSDEYTSLNYQWEQRSPHRAPSGYLVARSSTDVQAAVRCARPLGLHLVAKGGGHSYEKHSFGREGDQVVVVDLQKLNALTVHDEGAGTGQFTVGAGVLLAHIAWPLYSRHNLVLPTGTCPTVGIAGLALGGGYGYLSRLHGLTTDQILELEVVTADGQLRVVNSDSNSDLFWALKGCGTGSFGIVTSLKLQGYAPPHQIVFGYASYPLALFPLVFQAFQSSLAGLGPELIPKLAVSGGQLEVEVCHIQQDALRDDPLASVRTYIEKFPYTLQTRFSQLNYPDFLLESMFASSYGITDPADLQNLTRHSHTPRAFKAKSFFGSRASDADEMEAILAVLGSMPTMSADSSLTVAWSAMGGKIDDQGYAAESSFVHRGARALYVTQAFYQGQLGAEQQVAAAWLRDVFSVATQASGGDHSYQNYADSELINHLQRYYGPNLGRLQEIKRDYDPTNFFRHPQSIPLW